RGARALLRHRMGADAVQLASPSLARAKAETPRERALDSCARRGASRATPHGLLAGVCMGKLADRTAIATGTPIAHLVPSWERIDALARALLDDPDLRARTRLRVAPSAVQGAAVVRWLGPGDPFDDIHEAELTAPLPAILSAAARWAPWTDVRAAAGAADATDDVDVDEMLLTLLDDGLLQGDPPPPITGA